MSLSYDGLFREPRVVTHVIIKKESTQLRERRLRFQLLCSLPRSFCAASADFPLAPLSAQFLPVFNSNGLRQRERSLLFKPGLGQ